MKELIWDTEGHYVPEVLKLLIIIESRQHCKAFYSILYEHIHKVIAQTQYASLYFRTQGKSNFFMEQSNVFLKKEVMHMIYCFGFRT